MESKKTIFTTRRYFNTLVWSTLESSQIATVGMVLKIGNNPSTVEIRTSGIPICCLEHTSGKLFALFFLIFLQVSFNICKRFQAKWRSYWYVSIQEIFFWPSNLHIRQDSIAPVSVNRTEEALCVGDVARALYARGPPHLQNFAFICTVHL